MSEGGRWAAAAVLLGTIAPAATSLPPEVSFVDNLVADPSFESSFFAPNWEGAGLTRTTPPNVRSGAGATRLATVGATVEANVSQTIVFAPVADGAYPTEVRVRGWAQPLGIAGCDPAGCAGFSLAANAVVLNSGGSTTVSATAQFNPTAAGYHRREVTVTVPEGIQSIEVRVSLGGSGVEGVAILDDFDATVRQPACWGTSYCRAVRTRWGPHAAPFVSRCVNGTSGYLSPAAAAAMPTPFPIAVPTPVAATATALPPSSADGPSGQLQLTLRRISLDCGTVAAVARSYNGHPWEGLPPSPLHPECTGSSCTVLIGGDDFYYRVDADVQNVPQSEAAAASRLLVQGSFGPTSSDITAALALAARDPDAAADDDDLAVAAAWVESQMAKNATLLRAHFRQRANPRFFWDSAIGGGAGPCDDGARFNHYAFNELDVGRVIEVHSDPALETFVIKGAATSVTRTENSTFGGAAWPGACRCRADSTCDNDWSETETAWCIVESSLYCGDAEDAGDGQAYSFNACNVPDDPGHGHTLLQSGVECEASEGEVNFGPQTSVAACAQRCRDHPDCIYFLVGLAGTESSPNSNSFECWMEATEANDSCGPGGFVPDDYDFYKLDDDPATTLPPGTEARAGVLNMSAPVSFRICRVEETVGGRTWVVHSSPSHTCEASEWLSLANPAVAFAVADASFTQVYNLADVSIQSVWDTGSISLRGHRDSCTAPRRDGQSFIGIADGGATTYYHHDRRMRLVENTPESPADTDATTHSAGRSGVCPAVPRTAVNEENCVRRSGSSCGSPTFSAAPVTLDHATLVAWQSKSAKLVYAIRGLRLESGSLNRYPACTEGASSRWVQVASSGAGAGFAGQSTPHSVPWGFSVTQTALTIAVGDTVTWTWTLDGSFHNVVSGVRPDVDGNFASSYQNSGSFSHTFTEVGVYPYYCTPHPGMDATIIVQADNSGGAVVLTGDTATHVTAAINAAGGVLIADVIVSDHAPPPPVISTGFVRLASNVECDSALGEYNFGDAATVEECAQLCRERTLCKYFLYGVGGSAGECWQEGAARSDDCGPDGFMAASYNFYKLNDQLDDSGCLLNDSTIGAYVEISGTECWQHVHPDEGNVYDFSAWSLYHPGNAILLDAYQMNPFTSAAEEGRSEFGYPIWHPMNRFEENANGERLPYIGKLGEDIAFSALPPSLQTVEMAAVVGAMVTFPGVPVEVCGSRGEVENDPSLGNRFRYTDASANAAWGLDQPEQNDYRSGKEMTWTTVALNATDQLRQKTAWALSQIFSMGANNFDYEEETEAWTTYFDIFVGHAFGNYRDILQEVSLSPLMGEYLTLAGNAAFSDSGMYPDENFAREIMQLFSIGLWELNVDGSHRSPQQSTYTNEDIMAFARVWTGWGLQDVRGNLMLGYDGLNGNIVDPMRLTPGLRDKFPKSLLGGARNLGDSYPLCSQLPARHFLQRGAKYRYHGTTSILGEPYDNAAGYAGIREHFSPDPATSALYAELCSASSGGAQRCTFPPVVTLTSTLSCTGATECGADTLKAVKIVDGDATGFYTYVEPPCVRLQFFEGGRRGKYATWAKVCADPETVGIVGAQCCYNAETHPSGNPCPSPLFPFYESHTGNANHGDVCRAESNRWTCPIGCQQLNAAPHCVLDTDISSVCHLDREGIASSGGGECKYVSEAMTYRTASARCAAEYPGSTICPANPGNDFSTANGASADWQTTCGGFQFSWTQEPCALQVQVLQSGEVSVVDRSTSTDHLEVDSGSNFPVVWGPSPPGATTAFPAYSSNCTAGCQVMSGGSGSCLCEANVVDTPLVFEDPSGGGQLPTITELRAALYIGAAPPESHGSAGPSGYTLCTAPLCTSRAGVQVYTRGTESAVPAALDIDTVFELVDTPATRRPSVRHPAKYLLNRVSTVHVGRDRAYRTLNPNPIQVASCIASTQSNPCSNAYDGDWDYWVSDAAIEPPVGAWIQLDLGTEQEVRVVTVHTLQGGFAKDVRLDFSDGSTQLLTLEYTAEYVVYPLATTVTTSFVKMTVVSLIALPCVFPYVFDGVTYTECSSTSWRANDGPWCATQVDDGGIMDGWGNCAVDGINTVPGVRSSGVETGLREVMFHGPGMASVASSTPCEDVGLLPVGQTECEAAYPFFVRLQNEVAQGDDSRNSVRHVRWQPPGCSSAVGEAPDYDGDDAACFNTRPFAMYWSTEYWPVCRIPSVQSDITGFQFRNPVHFLLSAGDAVVWGDYRRANPFRNGNHLAAAAEHETEALLDHLFEHNNTAPFVASRMIQRLVTSNPSPRYIRAVATAFQEGSYGGTVYSGKYGCMASTVAAVLLDREARSSILDRDPLHGQLREPLVKVIHVMRAMEFASKRGMEVDLELMPRKIGQMAFLAPSVFGFYLPEFAPNGIVADAGLVAPEAQISTAPATIGFLNGLSSLIDYGLTDCDNGFGGDHDKRSRCDTIRNKVAGADGDIHFAPTYPANPTKTIDELALLLTAGRLSVRTRDVIEAVYAKYLAETAFDVAAGMVQAVGALVPASECLAAVQTELGVLPITATCTASSVATWGGGQTCEHVFEQIDRSSTWTSWVSDGIEDPIGSWIRLQFAEATLVDKMVFASTWTSNYSPLQRVRLAFSDGSTQLVNLDASFDAFTYQFTSVLTSYVTITVESKHTVPCVFPFIDQGVTYSECSDIDGNGELWCATQVDENGVLEISGECAADGIHTTGGDHAAIRLLKFYTPDSAFDPYDVQQRGYLDTITSSDTPPGCSYGGWDNRAKFNLDPVGCGGLSCGRHPSVAQGEDHMWASSSTVNSPGTSTAWKAIDGSSTACFETSWQDDPWWQLDLGAVEQVTSVIVQNPRRNWAGGFNIEIDGTVCASAVITELDSTTRIPCEGTGRVVRIVLPGTNVQFGFCEVVVNLLDQPDAEGGYASNPAAESLALTHALKLLSLAPEFHTTSIATPPLNGPVDRPPPTQTESQGRPYKAIVVVFLHGGADSYGMVVPHSECGSGFDLHAEYSAIRGNSSLSKGSLEATLIRTDAPGTPPQSCDVFGLHPSLPLLRQSYVDGDAAVLANTGPLVEPMSLSEYNDGTKEFPPGIYAHNTMQADVYTVHSGERDAKGVLGRMVGKMGGLPVPMKTGMYTMDGYAKMLDGGYLTPEAIDPDEGLVRFRDYAELQESINELTRPESKSLFSETFADLLQHALHSTETLGAQLDNVTLTSGRTFPATSLGSQLHETSKVIQLDGENGVERSAFFTQIGGFDAHGTHDIAGHMAEIDGALGSFVQEMKDQSMWDNVTVVVASEFGRTLSTNGQGSDHGWGGNYFVLGGGVKGGQMLGSYPGRLTEFVSEVNVGRGRFIPTTPWESIWNGVSEWYGIDAAGRAEILPNMANFDAGDIFTQAQLYKS